MKEYYIIFSCGLFEKYHKIFSYEKDAKYYLPIYTDSEIANAFQSAIEATFKDDLSIHANLCTNKKHLLEMLKTIASLHQELIYVTINPNIVSGDTKGNINLIDEEYLITDYIEIVENEANCNQDPE